MSAEGTTQGDPLAMALYALSVQPLITSLQAASSTKQCWFADDACGAGSVLEIKKWWDVLNSLGPVFGYFPNPKKCWIVSKPDKEASVKEVFKDTAVNVTVEGQKHLGAVIGSQEYLEEYVTEKVTNWVSEITKLAEFAISQPQACYAAYTFGLKHRWTYFLRTLPDIQELLEPLENAISKVLIPAITEHRCTPLDRDILALPVRLGGLGMTNPCLDANLEHRPIRPMSTSTTTTLPPPPSSQVIYTPPSPHFPISTSTTTTRATRPPLSSPSSSSSSHRLQITYTPITTQCTNQIPFTPSTTNPRIYTMNMRFHTPCNPHSNTLHLYSINIPIEIPPTPRPSTSSAATQKPITQTLTDSQDKGTQTL